VDVYEVRGVTGRTAAVIVNIHGVPYRPPAPPQPLDCDEEAQPPKYDMRHSELLKFKIKLITSDTRLRLIVSNISIIQ